MSSSANTVKTIKSARQVYIIGNGGSYANAVHICNDFLAKGVKAFTLDPATLTASANDYGYETVFERWIAVVGQQSDVLVALSGSGRSPNILRAVHKANEIGMNVITVYGAAINQDMQRAEEYQLEWGHNIWRQL